MLLRQRVLAVAERRELPDGQESSLTVAALIQRLEEEYQIQGRKSIVEMRYHAAPIVRAMGTIKADELTTDDLRRYVRARQQLGRANATINREMAALRRAYTLVWSEGLMPWMPKFPMLKETGLRQGTYTAEEMDSLIVELPPHLKPVAWFAYYTGRRRGEILQIKWDDVDFKEGYIRIRASTTKTGQPDRIPLSGELLGLLQSLSARTSVRTGYVFNYQGKPFKTFWRTWKRACQRAGLPDRLFHDMRRTVATDLIEAGVAEQTAMAITGHKTRSVFQRYHIVRSDAVKRGMKDLEQHRRRKE